MDNKLRATDLAKTIIGLQAVRDLSSAGLIVCWRHDVKKLRRYFEDSLDLLTSLSIQINLHLIQEDFVNDDDLCPNDQESSGVSETTPPST